MTIVKNTILEAALMEEVQDLIKKGVIAEVPPSAQQTGFYSAYFIIPKKE